MKYSMLTHRWQSWIMYFREAGYDCIDMTVEVPSKTEGSPEEALANRTYDLQCCG